MRHRWWVTVTAATVSLALTGCGSTASASASEPTVATAVAALSSVSDTASARSDIVINDLGAIWRAAGLPAEPSLRQFASHQANLAAVQTEVGGSAIGSALWGDVPRYPAPFGYRVLGLRVELEVGPEATGDGEVWGPINPNRVVAAVEHLKSRRSRVGQSTVFDFGPRTSLQIPPGFGDALLDLRFLAVNRQGGRVVEGGKLAAKPGVTALANATHVADPVSSDPTVAPLLRAFGNHVQSMVLGTGFINLGPVTAADTPAEAQRLLEQTGISRLPAGPLMVGLGYTGGPPTHQSVLAAALYPSAADAQAAVATVGKYTKSGFSHQLNMPYSRLWHVISDTAQGRLVTMHLTTSNGAPTQAIIENDFPLFWN